MNQQNTNHTIDPSNLTDEARKELMDGIQSLSDSFLRVEAERDAQKQILEDLFNELGVEKKLVRRIAKVYHKNSFQEEKEASETFEEFYDTVVKHE